MRLEALVRGEDCSSIASFSLYTYSIPSSFSRRSGEWDIVQNSWYFIGPVVLGSGGGPCMKWVVLGGIS